ncbi:hypothetical protein GCM10010336_50320 [Streptomyces goshikiensis]|nr:hypothetical protein GCM10010336_50320 [Streptomyces goshikiensis]
MSFDDEWSQIKAEQTRMHLNQLDGGGAVEVEAAARKRLT